MSQMKTLKSDSCTWQWSWSHLNKIQKSENRLLLGYFAVAAFGIQMGVGVLLTYIDWRVKLCVDSCSVETRQILMISCLSEVQTFSVNLAESFQGIKILTHKLNRVWISSWKLIGYVSFIIFLILTRILNHSEHSDFYHTRTLRFL